MTSFSKIKSYLSCYMEDVRKYIYFTPRERIYFFTLDMLFSQIFKHSIHKEKTSIFVCFLKAELFNFELWIRRNGQCLVRRR